MIQKKAATKAATTKNLPVQFSNKLMVCLHHLYQRGRAGINTLEAKTLYEDTCLHTTVNKIAGEYGIVLEREFEVLTNRAGRSTRFMRYWLNDEQQELVAELLGFDIDGGAV